MAARQCQAVCTRWLAGLAALLALVAVCISDTAWLYEGFLQQTDVGAPLEVKRPITAEELQAKKNATRSRQHVPEAKAAAGKANAGISVLARDGASAGAKEGGHEQRSQAVAGYVLAKPRPSMYYKQPWIVEQMRCVARLYEAVRSLRGGNATDMVLGANDGKRFDPAQYFEYWFSAPDHRKVFVEPVPPLFQRLEKNTAGLRNVVALNRAVRRQGQGNTLVLYCWDIDMVESAVHGGATPLPREAKQPQDYWTALCSTDRSEVVKASNVLDTPEYRKLGVKDQERVRWKVEQHIKKYTVPASTPDEIVKELHVRNAGYIQIDVEGMDNQIVSGLPLGRDGFLPKVILYENHRGETVKPFLNSHGYEVCCCFNYQGNNMVAVLDTPSWVAGRRKCEQRFREGLESMYGGGGTDIVIGARDGNPPVLWPAPWLLYWVNVPEHQKVFVEPAPLLAKALRHYAESTARQQVPISNFTVMRVSVRGAEVVKAQQERGVLFCWDEEVFKHPHPLPPEVRQPTSEWKYQCAESKRRVMELSRVLDTPFFTHLSQEDKARVAATVEKCISQSPVVLKTIEDVIRKAKSPGDVRYLQIHPAELSGEVVKDLPLLKDGFLPKVITYGKDGGEDATRFLEASGHYQVCCCVERGGSNMVAIQGAR